MNEIDDNMLASYLEGTLDNEESCAVEDAIEHDETLKAIVDGWINTFDEETINVESENTNVVNMPALTSIRNAIGRVKKDEKKPIFRSFLAAAVVFAFACSVGLYLMNGNNSTDGGWAGGYQEVNYSNIGGTDETENTVSSDELEEPTNQEVTIYTNDEYINIEWAEKSNVNIKTYCANGTLCHDINIKGFRGATLARKAIPSYAKSLTIVLAFYTKEQDTIEKKYTIDL